ncbi:DUF2852 domain-containing protein [Marimonas lutisalis]|uniref:DUF2852 domain-containing protein n=1 Tax=Marimonas lutisalis TaxID=2545756 RepID=UPI0010F70F38|nr:DUF2852 domain-containing protein [Marimonas lutisalis]
MTTATHTATAHSPASGPMAWLRRAEAWLDSKGKGAWIAAMVLGFIFFWPIGLFLVFYITYTHRWSTPMFNGSCARRRHHHSHRHAAFRSSGNSAFDSYKEETLRRLEDEQQQFEEFLQRLREAKDKAEFDQFMDERAKEAARPDRDEADIPERQDA